MGTEDSQPEKLCPDWVFINNSNVHIAVNRGWFETYTPFQTTIGSLYSSGGSGSEAIGIGTVRMSVKKNLKAQGSKSHNILVLRDVLHVPLSCCNIIGVVPGEFDEFVMDPSKGLYLKNSTGTTLVAFDPKARLFNAKLSGPPVGPVVGPSLMKGGVSYMINACWPNKERVKWEIYRRCGFKPLHTIPKETLVDMLSSWEPPYDSEEKEYVKKHFKDEFHFLLQHSLKIHDEEDRGLGRSILRGLMSQDDSGQHENDSFDDDDSFDDEDDEFGEDDEEDMQGHMSDYLFTEEELDFIEKGWGNSMNFMFTYGLKFYDSEDCEDAKAIIKVLREDD